MPDDPSYPEGCAPESKDTGWFHEDWKDIFKKSWAIRMALFWGAVSGLIAVWSAFESELPVWAYATIGIVANASITVARLLKQPGTDLV